jgi:hypothetical protein
MKNTIIIVIVVILLALVGYQFIGNSSEEVVNNADSVQTDVQTDENRQITRGTDSDTETDINVPKSVIGTSVNGKSIVAHHYGTGEKEVLFVGGIHGKYSRNTVSVANELVDYLDANPTTVPENVRVTVIPVLNPDGLEKEDSVEGRFNANGVDLNRNFACDWSSDAVWQNRAVDGGDSEFSEPESQALKNYVEKTNPAGVIVWYSAAGGVYSSSCHNGVSSMTRALTETFADASGYPAYSEFDFYEITGDAVNWMAGKGIPAISVLLSDHTNTEWTKNLAGIKAVLNYYAE